MIWIDFGLLVGLMVVAGWTFGVTARQAAEIERLQIVVSALEAGVSMKWGRSFRDRVNFVARKHADAVLPDRDGLEGER